MTESHTPSQGRFLWILSVSFGMVCAMDVTPQLRLNVGSVLGRSFSIWFRNLFPFTVITAVVYLPLLAYTYFAIKSLDLEAIGRWTLVVSVGSIILTTIASAVMIYAVVEQLRGNRGVMLRSIKFGISRFFPVLLVGILAGLCAVGPVFVAAFLGFIAGGLVFIAMIPALIFAVIIFMKLYVAVPAAVCEKPGIIGALKRSSHLTMHHKAAIFGTLFVLGVINWIFEKIINTIMLENMDASDLSMFMYVTIGMSIVTTSLGAVVNAVIYHDLRTMKDGLSVDELAAVFE